MPRLLKRLWLAGWGAVALLPTLAEAEMMSYTFGNITANNVANAAAGESQLSVEVSDVVGNSQQALFTFFNVGGAAMSITDVYFDDGTLLGIADITNGPGVSFSQGASPGNLPGGSAVDPPFSSTAGFASDSDPPAQPNGVNPGEYVAVLFNLISGKTYADVIAALDGGVDLRIGIHVQGFAGGGSESFINETTHMPEPSSLVLALAGLAAVPAFARKRRRTA